MRYTANTSIAYTINEIHFLKYQSDLLSQKFSDNFMCEGTGLKNILYNFLNRSIDKGLTGLPYGLRGVNVSNTCILVRRWWLVMSLCVTLPSLMYTDWFSSVTMATAQTNYHLKPHQNNYNICFKETTHGHKQNLITALSFVIYDYHVLELQCEIQCISLCSCSLCCTIPDQQGEPMLSV